MTGKAINYTNGRRVRGNWATLVMTTARIATKATIKTDVDDDVYGDEGDTQSLNKNYGAVYHPGTEKVHYFCSMAATEPVVSSNLKMKKNFSLNSLLDMSSHISI